MLRQGALYGVPLERGDKALDEWLIECEAAKAIAEWQLVRAGVASYEDLGYSTPEGHPPACKLLEWLTIEGEYAALAREPKG